MSFYTTDQCLRMAFVLGVHPEMRKSKCQLLLHTLITTGAWISIYLALSLLIHKEGSLTVKDFTETFSGMSMLIHGVQRTASLFFNRKNLADLLHRIKNHFWDENDTDMSENEKKYKDTYIKRLKVSFHVFIFFCIMNTSGFCYQTFLVDDDILVIDCYKPEWIPFYPFWFFQVLVMYFGVMIPIIVLDTLVMSLLVLAQIQFMLLNGAIEGMFETESSVKYNDSKLKRLIVHHVFLLDFCKRLNYTFSGTLLSYMVIIIISICVEMFNLSSGTDPAVFFRAVFYVIAALFQFIVFYCVPAQSLTDEADRLRISAYSSKWYDHPSTAPSLKLIIAQSQQEVIITAGGLVDINLDTSLSTVKTMVSYCMFLRTMGQTE